MKKLLLFSMFSAFALAAAAAPIPRFSPGVNSPRYEKLDKKQLLVLKPGSFEVVVPPKSAPAARYAGKVLSATLGEILNCKVPVVSKGTGKIALHVGDTALAAAMKLDINALDRDGFYIKSLGKQILIAGKDDPRFNPERTAQAAERATLFAVYDFLERFAGVRYYFPGEAGTVIPRKDEIRLPGIDIAERPDMQYRTFYFNPWKPIMEGQSYVYANAPENWRFLAAFQLRTSTLAIPNCHGLAYLALVERFGKEHPEYFSLNKNGSRWNGAVKVGLSQDKGHICWSNKAIREELLKDAEAVLTGKPASSRNIVNSRGQSVWPSAHQTPFFNLMPNDAMPPCYCKGCVSHFQTTDKQKTSDFMWNYFTSFARTLQERKIPGYVTCMAYANYKVIPTCEIPSNIIVQLALTGPYDERLPVQKGNDALLRQWNKKLGTRPYLWLYPSKCRAAVGWIPNTAPRAVGTYLKRQAGYTFGAFNESESDFWLFGFLNYYVAAKVMWNTDTDVDALLDEHFKVMYGAAAPVMKKVFDEFENIWLSKICGNMLETNEGPKGVTPSQSEIWNNIYNTAFINRINKEFDKAEKLVKNDAGALKRLKFIRSQFWGPVMTGVERYRKSCEINDESVMNELPAGETITIDGKLNDRAWKKAATVWLRNRKGDVTEVATKVSMLRDKDYFYFGFYCEEPETAKMIAADRKKDDMLLWQDNCVEVFLDTAAERKEYFQIMLSAKNCITDLHVRPGSFDTKWDSKVVSAVTTQPGKSWCAELKIPRSAMTPAKGKIHADFSRLRNLTDKTAYYNWIKLPPRNIVEQFAVVNFNAPENKNIVKDPDFQNQVAKKRFMGPWAAHDIINRDTKVFRFGGSSCRMNVAEGCRVVSQYFKPFKPNTTYRLSYFLKLENLSIPGLYVRIFEGNGKVHTLPRVFPKGTIPWHKLSFTFKTCDAPVKTKPNLFFLLSKKCTGTVWIDRVEIVEVDDKNTKK